VDAGWRVALPGAAGQGIETWDGRGSHSVTEFDELLRPVVVRERGEGIGEHVLERFTYAGVDADAASRNLCGQLMRHDDPAGTLHLGELGISGALLQQTRHFLLDTEPVNWPDSAPARDALLEPTQGATTALHYAASGELLRQIDAQGNHQRFTYTVAGALNDTRLTLAGPGQTERTLVSDLRYNAFGQIESETAGNGVITRHHYDPADGRLIVLSAHKANGTPLQNLKFRYDAAGNVQCLEDAAQPTRYFNNQRIEPIKNYCYDTLYQLIKATGWEARTGHGGPALPDLQPLPLDPNQVAQYTQTFHYDAGGNLLDLKHVGAQAQGRTLTRARFSNRCLPERNGRPPTEAELAAGFDGNGNLRELQAGQAMDWDLRNQLSTVRPVIREDGNDDYERYLYDGGGQRVRKLRATQTNARTLISEVRYLPGVEIRSHSGTGEVLHVITASAGSNSVQVLHWVAKPPEDITNDQVRYSLNDHLQSSTLELDQAADLISQEWYYPYGGTACFAARSATEAKYKTVRYSGKERDATGLYYYGFRYYAPWLQRWINPDPAGHIDGLNFYWMVTNNPILLIDHKGLMHRNSFTTSSNNHSNSQEKDAQNKKPTPPKPQEIKIYNFVDPRSENGAVRRKIVSSFTFPQPSITDSAHYYLNQSSPGNSFVGIMHIRTGNIHIYPLKAAREDASPQSWAKNYNGTTQDNGEPIMHAILINGILTTSHDQLVKKISGKREDYIGFSVNDLRHIRGYQHGGFLGIADYNTSVIYGRSRTLNSIHFKAISGEGVSYATDSETYKKNKGEFIFELPIEPKSKIINTLAADLGEEHEISKLLKNEFSRSEMNPNYQPAPHFRI
jgi:insecticidal toxin complex protein TccC